MGATIAAAIRTRKRFCGGSFGDAYDAYAGARAPHVRRRSAWRALAQQGYRAVVGLACSLLLLIGRMWLRAGVD